MIRAGGGATVEVRSGGGIKVTGYIHYGDAILIMRIIWTGSRIKRLIFTVVGTGVIREGTRNKDAFVVRRIVGRKRACVFLNIAVFCLCGLVFPVEFAGSRVSTEGQHPSQLVRQQQTQTRRQRQLTQSVCAVGQHFAQLCAAQIL